MSTTLERPVRATPAVAWRPVLTVAVATAAVLVALSGRYGYHRDELYFLEAGRHLAWGYPDQPPLTPLIARAMAAIAPHSLVVLRLPSAIAAALVVLLTGALTSELGGGRAAQTLAATCVAVSAVLLAVGHLLSTTTFDLLAWTALTWLAVRATLRDERRLWPAAGVVAGIGLLNKDLVAFLAGGLLVGVLVAGPRDLLRRREVWLGAAIALVLWSPNLGWQATHGWPQLHLANAIANGGSGSSQPRALLVPYQLVLVSPVLVPVWVTGLVRLFRDDRLRKVRFIAWTYVVLAVVFLVTGGKPYYLAGLYPVLLAAGAEPTLAWCRRTASTTRRNLLIAALVLSAVVDGVLMLPIVPIGALHATPIVAVDYDAGETVGWPAFAHTIARAYDSLPPTERAHAVVLTENYGEAGAVDRYGPALGLPKAYSGHNAYGEWGPPPETVTTVVAVGLPQRELRALFGSITRVARIDNGEQVDNDEQGTSVWICRDRLRAWKAVWPGIRHLG
jgi:4-amino-4-deoxy-L-arabinose transferase-like glycosyltransferase